MNTAATTAATINSLQKEIEQRQLAIEWMTANAAGKKFEVEWRAKNVDGHDWVAASAPSWNFHYDEYRRKPKPKIVPWTFEDMAQHGNSWFRFKNSYGAFRITVIEEVRVYFGNQYFPDYSSLLKEWEYSIDLKTWKPCGKQKE